MGTHVGNDGKVTFTDDQPESAVSAAARELDQAFTAIADAAVVLADAPAGTLRYHALAELRDKVAEWRACSERFAQGSAKPPTRAEPTPPRRTPPGPRPSGGSMRRRKPEAEPDPLCFCTPLERACMEALLGAAEPMTLDEVHKAVMHAGGGLGAGFGPWPPSAVRACALDVLRIGEMTIETADGRWMAA